MCFYEEYNGKCQNPGDPWCEKHSKAKCFQCGKQAVRYCFHEGMFVCGVDECAEHHHHH